MIINELKAIVPLTWEEESVNGPVLARDLIYIIPYAGKISWGFLEPIITNAEIYDGLLHDTFVNGRIGVNLFPG